MGELRDRAAIERDRRIADDTSLPAPEIVRAGVRLIADVGPLLERLDQAKAALFDRDLALASAEGRLDQQAAEIERLQALTDCDLDATTRHLSATEDECERLQQRNRWLEQRFVDQAHSVQHEARDRLLDQLEDMRFALSAAQAKCADWRRLWRDRYRNLWGISEQYRAELAAAQARAEAAEASKASLLTALHVALRHADGTLAEVDAETRRLELAGCQVILDQFADAAGDADRPQPDDCGRKCARCDAKHRETLPWPDRICALFIVCTDCGDKRCPRAAYHGNDCSAAHPQPRERPGRGLYDGQCVNCRSGDHVFDPPTEGCVCWVCTCAFGRPLPEPEQPR